MSHVMRKSVYAISERQRRRSACASAQSDQHLCCSLSRQYNASCFCIRNFKPLPSFCGCAGRFVSYLVESPKDRLSLDEAHMFFFFLTTNRLYIFQEFQSEHISDVSALCEMMQTASTSLTDKPLHVIPEDVQTVDGIVSVHMKGEYPEILNPHLPSGTVHPYQLDEFISNFRDVCCTFSFLFKN